mmetsp:Transcript_61373/g.107453  ORF Transcript_61373/g.107453 Transcript_61373/m.107453 type:complete len:201 (-) Transcript_61373:264-866(-)
MLCFASGLSLCLQPGNLLTGGAQLLLGQAQRSLHVGTLAARVSQSLLTLSQSISALISLLLCLLRNMLMSFNIKVPAIVITFRSLARLSSLSALRRLAAMRLPSQLFLQASYLRASATQLLLRLRERLLHRRSLTAGCGQGLSSFSATPLSFPSLSLRLCVSRAELLFFLLQRGLEILGLFASIRKSLRAAVGTLLLQRL